MEPHYRLRGSDTYVRARVFSSAGEYAWTQPVFRNVADATATDSHPGF